MNKYGLISLGFIALLSNCTNSFPERTTASPSALATPVNSSNQVVSPVPIVSATPTGVPCTGTGSCTPTPNPGTSIPTSSPSIATPSPKSRVAFASIKSLLTTHCFACHGQGRASGGLNMDTDTAIQQAASDIRRQVVVRKSMPPGGSLPESERELIRLWVEEGASLQ